MTENDAQIAEDLQIASYGEIPGTDRTQFMINANFGSGLFEALTLTVLVRSGPDEASSRAAALERARELAGAFSDQAQTGNAGEITADERRQIATTVELSESAAAPPAEPDDNDPPGDSPSPDAPRPAA